MSHSCVEIYVHVIFATKGRTFSILPNLERRLYGYLQAIANRKRAEIRNINGTQDHIHILVKLHAMTPIGELVKEFKAYSTAWMKKQGQRDFSWQEGYGAFSCSLSHLEAVSKYISKQKEHHRRLSFYDEIQEFTQTAGLKWSLDNESPLAGL